MMAHEKWDKGWLRNKPYVYNPEHPWFNPTIDNICRDLKNGQNRIIIFVGTPRSGKSWGSVWFQCFFNWCFYGREEYEPRPDNLAPEQDLYWDLDTFINATKDPKNRNKFITLEEQGIAQYAKNWMKRDVQAMDKLAQIFGIDNTNLLINLPYLFDLFKGTRLKGHYLLRFFRMSKMRVDIVHCNKWMSLTTEEAGYSPTNRWVWFPNVARIYPKLIASYEKKKQEFNAKKKEDLYNEAIGAKDKKSSFGFKIGKPIN